MPRRTAAAAPTSAATTAPPAQPNQSVIHALQCLSVLTASSEPVGVLQLARQLGMNRMRANRLLKTLAHLGMARQTASRKYLPGPAMHVLAARTLLQTSQVAETLRPLDELRNTGLLVAYGVLWERSVCYSYRAGPKEPREMSLSSNRLHPASQSSIGHILLAAIPSDAVESLYAGHAIPGYPQGTPSLQRALRQVREQGYALVPGSVTGAQPSLAVPVGNPAYAAIALAGTNVDRKIGLLLPQMQAVAQRIAE